MLSPIVIFCYKRLDTLKLSIESLLKCKEAQDTDVFVFSDAAAKQEDFFLVEEVRTFIHSIEGFKSVSINKRNFNHGIDNNIIEGLKEMSNKYESFIIVEDDIVVNPSFLTFMNLSLSYYNTNKKILSISGFSYVKKIPSNYAFDIYYTQRINAWGWATWSDRIKSVDWNLKNISKSFNKFPNYFKFNDWGSDRSNMLLKTIKGKIRTWDIRLDYHQFINNQFSIYPIISLCNNIGFQSFNATNTFGYNRYEIEFSDKKQVFWKLSSEIFIDKSIKKEFVQKNSIPQRLKTKLINFCLKFN